MTGNGHQSGLTRDWLAARLGVQPARIDGMRRAGYLVGITRDDGQHLYPSWQFGRDGRPLAVVPRLVAAARSAGVDERRLHEIVTMRSGLTGEHRLADTLRDGGEEQVLRALARAA
jgi:hypothetical protein